MTRDDKLNAILKRLREARIHHELRDTRDGAVSVDAAVPGERWEIDVLGDGSIEVEVFRSDGSIDDESRLDDLLARFSD